VTPMPPERSGLDDATPAGSTREQVPPKFAARPTHKDADQIGPYRILGKLGEGGMGIVYKAEQREPVRRIVALKIIKLGMDTKEVVARFEAERQALALMSHPNVAKVFEAGMTEGGRPFFAMEIVPGVPVTRYCDDEKLTVRQRLELFVPICQAVQHAHQKGIIHRDLKPSNILVQLIDGKAVPKVIDFGVAKATNQALTQHTLCTQSGTVVGTPEYMSPEQAGSGGLDVDTRTDIYSLGVILYELLTGKLPFEPASLRSAGWEGMARLLKEAEPPRPSTRVSAKALGDDRSDVSRIAGARRTEPHALRRELDGDLDWIVLRAMEKERGRRYETANGLAMDIQRHLNDEAVLARPPTAMYRLRKLVRRNRLAFVGAAGFVLALLLGLATSTFLFVSEAAARHRAVAAEREQTRLRENESELRRQAQAKELVARQKAYASDINLIQQALATSNLGRARELLDRQRPESGQQDLRGWEYRYLWQLCQSEASGVLCQEPNEIWSLSVSNDGALAAIGGTLHGRISVWDLRERRLIASLPAGDGYVSAEFSPTSSLLACVVENGARTSNQRIDLILWDAATRQNVAEIPLAAGLATVESHPALAFSADGRLLIVHTARQILVLEVPSGKKLRGFDIATSDSFVSGTGFAVAHDTSLAARGTRDGMVRVVDLATGRERWHAKADDAHVNCLAFSPDNKVLASAAGYLASSIELWDVASGKQIGRLNGHRAWVSSLVFWPDGKTLASSSADQTIRLWDVSHGFDSPPFRLLSGHRLEVWRLALLPDNRTLISGGKDGSVFLWDTRTAGTARGRVTIPQITAWRFAPDGESVVAIDFEGRVVRLHGPELKESEILFQMGIKPSKPSGYLGTAISPDCALIASWTPAGVKIWNVRNGALVTEIASPPERFPVAFSNHALLFRQFGNTMHERDLLTGNEIQSWRLASGADQGALSPDGRLYVSFGWTGESAIHDLMNRTDRNAGLEILQPQGARFSEDGRLLAVTSALGTTDLVEFPSCRKLAIFRGFLMGVHSVAFSPDGKRLAASSNAIEAVKLWDIESRQELITLEGEGSRLSPAYFSADGSALGALSEQGQLQIWRAPSWAQIGAAESRNGR
jgi:serine/threonine protein kinase/WD40 repeat protein